MFETILGFFLSICSALFNVLIQWFDSSMGMDLEQFRVHFPVFVDIYYALIPIAFVLVFIFAGASVFRYFAAGSGISEIKERPSSIVIRVILASSLILFSGHFIAALIKLFSYPYRAFLEIGGGHFADNFDIATVISNIVSNIATDVTTALIGAPYQALCLILILMIAYNLLKLIIEICERYLMVGVLAYMSPLAMSTVASQATAQVFSKFVGMLFGQCLLMSLSIAVYDMVLSGLNSFITDPSATFVKLLLVMSGCRIGCRLDTHLQQLGVGVGTTGGSLMDEMMALTRTALMFSRHGGGTGRAGGILGGTIGPDGTVTPNAFGRGLTGGLWTAFRRGAATFKQGGGINDISASASEGFKEGFGFAGIKKGATPGETLKNTVKANATAPIAVGRKMSTKFSGAATEQRDARSAVTKAKAGTATKSADGSKANLNDVAKQNGLSLSKSGEITGKSSQAVGDFMAANINNPATDSMISQTARAGSREASEAALFGKHNDLAFDPDGEMTQAAVDQNLSDMTLSTFGDDMARMEENSEDLSDEQRGVLEAYKAMKGSMEGGYDDGKLSGVHASDVDGDPDKGRELTAGISTKNGSEFGRLSIKDQKAFDQLTPEQKEGYVPLTSATGQQYYAKATGVSIKDGKPGAIQNPMSALQAAGATTTTMDGKEVLSVTDAPAADATKLNSLLGSNNPTAKQIATNTAQSDLACPPAVAQSALFGPDTGPIQGGNDAAVASMLQTAIPSEELNRAATSLQTESGTVIPAEDAGHFSEAVAAAAKGEPVSESGYGIHNITKDQSGVVRGEYTTPAGESYGVAFEQAPAVPSGGVTPSAVPTEYDPDYVPPADLDDRPPDDYAPRGAGTPVKGPASIPMESPPPVQTATQPSQFIQNEQTSVRIIQGKARSIGGGAASAPSFSVRSESVGSVREAYSGSIGTPRASGSPTVPVQEAPASPVVPPQPRNDGGSSRHASSGRSKSGKKGSGKKGKKK